MTSNQPNISSPPPVSKPEQFLQSGQQWDLVRLYKDLATAKGRPLSHVEKLQLRGLLCGLSPAEMADKLHKNPARLESHLSTQLYQYVKILMKKPVEKKMGNWRNVCKWLAPGYKIPGHGEMSSVKSSTSLPIHLPIQLTISMEKNIIISDVIVVQNDNNGVRMDIHLKVQELTKSP